MKENHTAGQPSVIIRQGITGKGRKKGQRAAGSNGLEECHFVIVMGQNI